MKTIGHVKIMPLNELRTYARSLGYEVISASRSRVHVKNPRYSVTAVFPCFPVDGQSEPMVVLHIIRTLPEDRGSQFLDLMD